MKEEGIKALWIKKFKPLGNKVPVRGLKNIVNREFKPERKNKIWVTEYGRQEDLYIYQA